VLKQHHRGTEERGRRKPPTVQAGAQYLRAAVVDFLPSFPFSVLLRAFASSRENLRSPLLARTGPGYAKARSREDLPRRLLSLTLNSSFCILHSAFLTPHPAVSWRPREAVAGFLGELGGVHGVAGGAKSGGVLDYRADVGLFVGAEFEVSQRRPARKMTG